jgi:hypothetical protein
VTVEPTPGNDGKTIKACNRGLRENSRENLRAVGLPQDMRGVTEHSQTYVSDDTADCVHRKNIQCVIAADVELELGRKVANRSAHHTEADGGS